MANYFIEFVGGPFDGHLQPVSVAPKHLAAHAAVPVSEKVFRLLEGKPIDGESVITSVAVYRLYESAGVCRYQFVIAKSPADLHV